MRSSDFDAPTPVKLDTSKLDGRLFEAHSSSKTKNGKDFSMNDLSKLMMVYKRGVELQSRSGDFSAEKARVASNPHQLRRRTVLCLRDVLRPTRRITEPAAPVLLRLRSTCSLSVWRRPVATT